MSDVEKGSLLFFCGKMGAGKSTLAKKMAGIRHGVLISEDEWLASLYSNQINSFDDYIKHSSQLRPLIKSHVQSLLVIGTNVVMDFPANTHKQRQWFSNLTQEIDAECELIYLNMSDERCLKQIAQRRIEQPSRAKFDTEEMFHHVIQYFEAPSESELLNLTIMDADR